MLKTMKNFFLSKVRLTYYYPILFFTFFVVILFTNKVQLTGSQAALFSVNSFLLAFYLGPILNGQKSRIDELAKIIRNEAIAFFNLAVQTQGLVPATKKQVKAMAQAYLKASVHNRKPAEGEKEYENMLRYCIDYEGKDKETVRKILDILIKNQENRSSFSMQLRASVFSHEWFVLLVLFAITLSYVIIIDYGSLLILSVVAALLCTGLSLLMLILAKLTTLTHKKAKTIWDPLERLLDTDFKHIE